MRASKTIRICTHEGTPTDTLAAPGTDCDIMGCGKSAYRFALYPWGSSALCESHYVEETGSPRPQAGTEGDGA